MFNVLETHCQIFFLYHKYERLRFLMRMPSVPSYSTKRKLANLLALRFAEKSNCCHVGSKVSANAQFRRGVLSNLLPAYNHCLARWRFSQRKCPVLKGCTFKLTPSIQSLFGALVLKLARMPSSEGVYFQTYSQHTIIVLEYDEHFRANAHFRRCVLSNLHQAYVLQSLFQNVINIIGAFPICSKHTIMVLKYDKHFWRLGAKVARMPSSAGVFFLIYSKHGLQ